MLGRRGRRLHHGVHRPGLSLGLQRRAVPPPPDLALRRPHRVARDAGRAVRVARGVSGARLHAREAERGVQAHLARARHADRHPRAAAHGGDRARLPGRGRRPPTRAGADADAATPSARASLLRPAARRDGDAARRRARRRHRPRRPRPLDGRGGDRGRAARGHAGGARADAGRARARPQARQLVRRAALHLPLLRDRAARGRGAHRRARLPAVCGLRRHPRQPRAGPRALRPARVGRGGAALDAARRWRARRSRRCSTSSSTRRASGSAAWRSSSTSASTASGRWRRVATQCTSASSPSRPTTRSTRRRRRAWPRSAASSRCSSASTPTSRPAARRPTPPAASCRASTGTATTRSSR